MLWVLIDSNTPHIINPSTTNPFNTAPSSSSPRAAEKKDMCVYIRMVCDTIVTTVPKSVVHCMVRKAEKNLLNHMFGHVHQLSEPELQRMLAEDDDVVRKRTAGEQLVGVFLKCVCVCVCGWVGGGREERSGARCV